MAFHRARLAAPEAVVSAVLQLVGPRHHRQEVGDASVDRFGLGEDVIPQRPLLVVGDRRARLDLEELPRELEEIIGAARLAGDSRQVRPLTVGSAKGLFRGHAARRVEVMLHHGLPEELRQIARGRVAMVFVIAQRGDDLRDERVRVLSVQAVAMRAERVQDARIVEDLRGAVVARLTRNPRQIAERLPDAAELALAHRRRLLGRERQNLPRRPVAEALRHLERLFVAAEFVLVEESLQDLVLHVPGRPHTDPGDDLVDVRLRERPDPARPERVLAELQLMDGDCSLVACHCRTISTSTFTST